MRILGKHQVLSDHLTSRRTAVSQLQMQPSGSGLGLRSSLTVGLWMQECILASGFLSYPLWRPNVIHHYCVTYNQEALVSCRYLTNKCTSVATVKVSAHLKWDVWSTSAAAVSLVSTELQEFTSLVTTMSCLRFLWCREEQSVTS